MKNEDQWKASKFVLGSRGLMASRDAGAVAVASRLTADSTAAFLERALREHARGSLLDLGCGTVPLYQAYKPYISEITCVDWGHSPHRIDHIDVQHDLTQPLPFPDGRFDTILLSDVLEHIPEPLALWREMVRVLRPGGKIVLNVPFLYWLHEEPFDFYRYTEFALRRFAEQSGAAVVEIVPIGGAAEVLTDIFGKTVARYRFGKSLASFAQRLCAGFARTRVGRGLQRRTLRKLPAAYGMVAVRE